MKQFLITLAVWVILALALAFFFAGTVALSGVYLIAALVGVAGAVVTHCFVRLSGRIDALEKRLDEREKE